MNFLLIWQVMKKMKIGPKKMTDLMNSVSDCISSGSDFPFISEKFKPLLKISEEMPTNYKTSNLNLVEKEYNKLREIENPSVDFVMRSCAIIQWLIAQETPYIRGSDSIANILTKSIMHANGIYISPLKDGISLDFEAFDTDLDDYIKKYPDFFKVKPYKIEN